MKLFSKLASLQSFYFLVFSLKEYQASRQRSDLRSLNKADGSLLRFFSQFDSLLNIVQITINCDAVYTVE